MKKIADILAGISQFLVQGILDKNTPNNDLLPPRANNRLWARIDINYNDDHL